MAGRALAAQDTQGEESLTQHGYPKRRTRLRAHVQLTEVESMTNAVKRLKRQNAEKRERWKRANSNPLIWFPVRLLAARGSLVVSANSNIVVPTGKGYNIRSSKGLPGILKVRDWINEAYQLCFDILEDPWQVAYDELLAADEEEIFLNWPNGMTSLGEEYQRWEIEQVRNRPPKATDTPQLRIATFFVCSLEYEDLFLLSPDEISLFSRRFRITELLQEQWRYTISKFLDFAVEQGTKPNAANDTKNLNQVIEKLIQTQDKMAVALITQGVTLDRIDANTRPRKPTRGDCEVTQDRASEILARANCPVTSRTIQNWEKGKGTPEGYSSELRKSLVAFTTWARDYAQKEQGKINLKNAVSYRDGHGYK